jgi:SAM-dependent methyltransferase
MSYHCRSCGSEKTKRVVDLGSMPLANRLLDESGLAKPEPCFPLDVLFCEDCALVQISETVPPEQLFSDYVYFSSVSDAVVSNAKSIADRLASERHLSKTSLVAEAASNDGYLLKHYQALGIQVLGIEPAQNIAAHANAAGIRTRCAFFGREGAARMKDEGLAADVFHANNVVGHVADLNGFLAGIAILLKPDGVASLEAPYVRDLIDHLEFDTIYHEHLCYFSLTSIGRALKRHGLIVSDVEHIPIHGGTLRYFVSHQGATVHARVTELLAEEEKRGLTGFAYYSDFAQRIATLKIDLKRTLEDLKKQGKSIVAYGASAKGSTLLNTFGIGKNELDFMVDRSPVKQGRYTPGTHLKIMAPETLLEAQPDYLLLLTWNFADEILAQQKQYLENGGKVIIPVPSVHIV